MKLTTISTFFISTISMAILSLSSTIAFKNDADKLAAAPTTTQFIAPVNTAAPTTTTTTIYVDPVALAQSYVNSLTYNYKDPAPAMEAFQIVAQTRGWTQEEINSWLTAAQYVMERESGFCPNLRRGAVLASNQGCILAKQGPYQDSGFGQLIRIHYNEEKGWLCERENLCSAEEIVATPWNSMTAFVALIEWSGLSGWCYEGKTHRPECDYWGLEV